MERDKRQLVQLNDRQFEKCIAGTISQNRTSIMKPSQLAKMTPDDPRLVIKSPNSWHFSTLFTTFWSDFSSQKVSVFSFILLIKYRKVS